MKIILTTISLLFISIIFLPAQIPFESHEYLVNKLAISPAYAGHNDNFEIFATYRKGWLGVEKAPEGLCISANGRFYKSSGVGIDVEANRAGIFQHLAAKVSYAYHLQLSPVHALRAGLSVGVYQSRLDFSDLTNEGLIDPLLQSNPSANKTSFNTGFGIAYSFYDAEVGFAIPEIIDNSIDSENGSGTLFTSAREYRIHLLYRYKINAAWYVEPVILFNLKKNDPLAYSISLQAAYKQLVWLNMIYSNGHNITVGVGGALHRRLILTYNYDLPLSGIVAEGSGAHEITLGVLIGKKNNSTTSIFGNNDKAPYYQWVE